MKRFITIFCVAALMLSSPLSASAINSGGEQSDIRITDNGFLIDESNEWQFETIPGSEEIFPDIVPPIPRNSLGTKVTNIRKVDLNLFTPLTQYVTNNYLQTPPFPTVGCSYSQGITVSASLSTTVQASVAVISGALGFNVSGSYNLTAGQSYSFPIPYGQQARVVIRYTQTQANFNVSSIYGSGSGTAYSPPRNKSVDLQRIYLW